LKASTARTEAADLLGFFGGPLCHLRVESNIYFGVTINCTAQTEAADLLGYFGGILCHQRVESNIYFGVTIKLSTSTCDNPLEIPNAQKNLKLGLESSINKPNNKRDFEGFYGKFLAALFWDYLLNI
jgi:hypothetical protein